MNVEDIEVSPNEIEYAKNLLRKAGYYVYLESFSRVRDNLSSSEDYMEDDECESILAASIDNDYINDEIYSSLRDEIRERGFRTN